MTALGQCAQCETNSVLSGRGREKKERKEESQWKLKKNGNPTDASFKRYSTNI
jgi:hypothetical protein